MQPLGNSILPRILSGCFGAASSLRNTVYDHLPSLSHSAPRPVVSIGGIHAGGTGKTPMALLVAKYFREKGVPVAFLTRGYGRRTRQLVISAPHTADSWENVGDEPALLHAGLPESWLGVSASRIRAARELGKAVPTNTVFILDDGFQHRQLKRDLDIVCLPADAFSSRLMPSGMLREPLFRCKRADIVCLIGQKSQADELELAKVKLAGMLDKDVLPVLYQTPANWKNLTTGGPAAAPPLKKPVLVCGIARPERFRALVSAAGIHPVSIVVFNDHHPFSAKDVQRLCTGACDGIVTTEKDAVKLRTLKLVNCPDIWYLTIDLAFSSARSKELLYSRLNGLIRR